MSDLEEIHQVLNAYARNVDDKTPEMFAAEVFTADAVIEMAARRLEGVDSIVPDYRGQIEQFESTAHVISNVEVKVDGDVATSSAYVTFWSWTDAEEAGAPLLGVYVDRLVRGKDGWRIAHRTFRRLSPAAGPL